MSEYKVIGKDVIRTDAHEKATGEAVFAGDVMLPGMLYGKLLRSPIAHGHIKSIDTSEAIKIQGVKAIITAKDPDIPKGRWGAWMFDYPVFPWDRIRFIGEPVAAVAAVDEDTAMEALNLIKVTYEELPPVLSTEEAQKADAPIIHEELETYHTIPSFKAVRYGNTAMDTFVSRGDVERGFAEADYIFEDEYSTHVQHQCYLEPHVSVAKYDAKGKITIWTTTQTVHEVRRELADCLEMRASDIRVITNYVGGGFGGKLDMRLEPFCVLLSKKTGKPVKMELTREEEFTTGHPRHAFKVKVRIGVSKEGYITAEDMDLIMDCGAYTHQGCGVCSYTLFLARGPYEIPNFKIRNRLIYTNKLPSGGFRGYGNPQSSFGRESLINKLCDELGFDPLEFRLKNAIEKNSKMTNGDIALSCEIKSCLTEAAKSISWSEKKGSNNGRYKRGRGIACMQHTSGLFATGAVVQVNEDGGLIVLAGCSEMGQGSKTVIAQIAAETFGIPYDMVNVVLSDTGVTPYNWAVCESRTTFTVGNAVKTAATKAKQKLLDIAADMLEVKVDELKGENGQIIVANDASKAVKYEEVIMYGLFVKGGPIIGEGMYFFTDSIKDPDFKIEGSAHSAFGAYIFGAQAVEVEVDTLTGVIEVINYASAHDAGRALNTQACEGQIEGAIAQGLGYAVTEELLYNEKTGAVMNPSFSDYIIPTFMDMPRQEHKIIIGIDDPRGPYGAKGIGEPALVPAAPAIAAAIHDALGIWIKDLPLTPEKIIYNLKQNSSSQKI